MGDVVDNDGASNRRAASTSKPSDLEYNVMQLLLRTILDRIAEIKALTPATVGPTAVAVAAIKTVVDLGATAAALATAKTVIDNTSTAVTNGFANVTRILGRFDTLTKVFPTLASGVVVTCDAAGNTLGAFAEIVPAATITTTFVVRGANVQLSGLGAGEYAEVVLYQGAADTEFARFFCQANNPGFFPITGNIIAANSKIRAKASCSAAFARAITISLSYHEA